MWCNQTGFYLKSTPLRVKLGLAVSIVLSLGSTMNFSPIMMTSLRLAPSFSATGYMVEGPKKSAALHIHLQVIIRAC